MKLLEDYLAAVRHSMLLMPAARREDIVRELGEELRTQLDDRSEELGRSLTEAEVDAVLQRFGHPLLVAGRYREGSGSLTVGRQLIGPELFPLYALIVAINLLLTAAGAMVMWLLLDSPATPGDVLVNLAVRVTIITLIFIAIDATVRQSVRRGWSMLTLPEATSSNRIARSESIVGLSITLFFANVWLNLPWMAERHLGNGSRWVSAPIWTDFQSIFFVPVLIIFAMSAGLYFADIVRPYRTRGKLLVAAATDAVFGGLLATTVLMNWSVVRDQIKLLGSGLQLERAERLFAWNNLTVASMFVVVAIVCAGSAVNRIRKASRMKEDNAGARTLGSAVI